MPDLMCLGHCLDRQIGGGVAEVPETIDGQELRSWQNVTDYTRKESPRGRQERQEGQGEREPAEGSQTSESRKAETGQAAALARCTRPAKMNGQEARGINDD